MGLPRFQQNSGNVIDLSEALPLSRRSKRGGVWSATGAGDLPLSATRTPKQREERVLQVPGLVKITYRTGREVWFFRFCDPTNGRRGSIRLGSVAELSFMEAVALAKAHRDAVRQQRSPKASQMQLDKFFATHYLAWAKVHKASWRDDESRYRLHLSPVFGQRALSDVRRREIQSCLEMLRTGLGDASGPRLSNASINRVLMVARAIYRLALDLGFLDTNPTQGLRASREDNARQRVLSLAELARLYTALQFAAPHFRWLILFLIYTAIRIGEALNARFCDVDEARGVLRLPRTKAGVAQEVHLSSQAREVVEELKRLRRNAYLFPSVRGDGPMHRPAKALKKVLAQAGIDGVTFHDMRRTAATEALNCEGVTLMDVSKVLRHQSSRTTEKYYVVTSERRLRHASESLGARLQLGLLAGAKVAPCVSRLSPSVSSRSTQHAGYVYG